MTQSHISIIFQLYKWPQKRWVFILLHRMGDHKHIRRDRLIIFGRYPVPGRTKTRLIPALGPAGAADFQRRLTEKTLDTVRSFVSDRSVDLEICFDGGSECNVRRWLGSGMLYSQQRPGELGERMHAAFLHSFQSGCRRVVLIGTDIPDLRIDHLHQAFNALSDHDLVLGPSTDGGYWLIGLNQPVNLYGGINWGKGTVFDETAKLARDQKLRFCGLESLTDIDTLNDLKQLSPQWKNKCPYISVIIPTLNEGANIEGVIHRAQDEDAEIIVVDGGSGDDTLKRSADAGARVEVSPRGRAVQQNRGAVSASGRVLLFLHADTQLPGGYVKHVFETLIDPGTALGAFRFRTDLDQGIMKVVELLTNIRSQWFKLPYGDQGLFVRKPLFEKIGGFPEVPIAEDLFLVRRISQMGRIRIAPADAVTSGRRWQSMGALRTTLINQIILTGCYLGVSPITLASLYRVKPGK